MPPQVKVGTSGYSYFWNEGKPSPFEWYVKQGFDTVEINATFYRFPSPAWVNVWRRAPPGFDFSIKVHRSITHYRRLGEGSHDLLERFVRPLEPLADRIAFWLLQMPPRFTYSETNLSRVSSFIAGVDLDAPVVVEFRDAHWWDHVDEVARTGAAFCSVDAPGLPRDIVSTNDVLYLRVHGREAWYDHVYSEEELWEMARGVLQSSASRRYVYFNNDTGMLPNGLLLRRLLTGALVL
jgi:uncharacterized protein YecE (DUF72 family)